MDEADRVGVNIVVTTGLSLAGYALGGPTGAVVAGTLPYIAEQIVSRRGRNVETVTEDACKLAGLSGAELAEWVRASEEHAAFLADAVDAAWLTLDRRKLRILSLALAGGLRDDARLEIDTLVIRALRELESSHIRVLSTIAETENPERGNRPEGAWITANLAAIHTGLADGMDAIMATLLRLGCVVTVGGTYADQGRFVWIASDFGRRCLARAREADSTPQS